MTRREIVIELRKEVRSLIKEYGIVVSREKFIGPVGRAWMQGDKNVIKIPPLTTIENIYVAFHEIAHVVREHYDDEIKKDYVQEYEAEKWALKKFKEFQVDKHFPKDYILQERRAKMYVFSYMILESGKIQERIKNWILKFN